LSKQLLHIGPGDFGSPGCERGNGFHKYIFKPSFYVYYAIWTGNRGAIGGSNVLRCAQMSSILSGAAMQSIQFYEEIVFY